MSLSKSKCWYSNNCSHYLKHAVPLPIMSITTCTIASSSQLVSHRPNDETSLTGKEFNALATWGDVTQIGTNPILLIVQVSQGNEATIPLNVTIIIFRHLMN